MVRTISRGFVGGGTLNSTKKRNLRAVMNIENKKRKEHYKPIYFTEEDFGDIKKEYDNPMVISILIHNFLVIRS